MEGGSPSGVPAKPSPPPSLAPASVSAATWTTTRQRSAVRVHPAPDHVGAVRRVLHHGEPPAPVALLFLLARLRRPVGGPPAGRCAPPARRSPAPALASVPWPSSLVCPPPGEYRTEPEDRVRSGIKKGSTPPARRRRRNAPNRGVRRRLRGAEEELGGGSRTAPVAGPDIRQGRGASGFVQADDTRVFTRFRTATYGVCMNQERRPDPGNPSPSAPVYEGRPTAPEWKSAILRQRAAETSPRRRPVRVSAERIGCRSHRGIVPCHQDRRARAGGAREQAIQTHEKTGPATLVTEPDRPWPEPAPGLWNPAPASPRPLRGAL